MRSLPACYSPARLRSSTRCIPSDTRARHRAEEKIADARLRLIARLEAIAYADPVKAREGVQVKLLAENRPRPP